MLDDLSLRRYMALFRGNPRSYGVWNPNKPPKKDSHTEKSEYGDAQARDHLEGRMGLGLVPIRDDGTCFWGAIDIDNHGSDKDTDIRAVERRVAELEYPLVACRSKSGGVHLYMFFNEPVRCDIVRQVLARWAKTLEVEGVDCIYPKQSRLATSEDGERALGNWINLPYFHADETKRFAVSNGKRLTLDAFLTKAETTAIDANALSKAFADDLSQMPPCLQARLKGGGFAPGERNEGTYQVAVFCRKRDPDTARDTAHDLSARFMIDDPLPFKERDKTIKSATSSKANYKCHVFKDVCDRSACRKLKWGISEAEFEAMSSRETMPVFHSLVKYHNTDPLRFDLAIGEAEGSRKIEGLTIEELSSFTELRKAVMARTHVVLPRLKNDEWDKMLRELFDKIEIDEVPEDATPDGAVRIRLVEFLRKADLKSEGDQAKDREALLRGVPVVQLHKDERVVMFRSVDFVNYLQKTKTDVIKNKDLWFRASRSMGVKNDRVRVGKQVLPVWYLPASLIEEETQHAARFEPEY